MQKTSIALRKGASISVHAIVQRQRRARRPLVAARAAGFMGVDPDASRESDITAVLVEATRASLIANAIRAVSDEEPQQVVELTETLLSIQADGATLQRLLKNHTVQRIQTKKRKSIHLDSATVETGSLSANGSRLVSEDGRGVLIGIVDTGFDLSHPMFLDQRGKLRVEGLLWQRGAQSPREYAADELITGWNNGSNPGSDDNGHGTHVASIAGGSKHAGFEGIAPSAKFLLVKTDFINTDNAVKWIYGKAGDRPCAVNMSLGHHWGAHDGTDVEERYHHNLAVSHPGKVICISAGNEREDKLHIGGQFSPGQEQIITFRVFRGEQGQRPNAVITFWHHQNDAFSISLILPDQTAIPAPALGRLDQYEASNVTIEIGRTNHELSNLIETEISLDFIDRSHPVRDLEGWSVKIRCDQANVGRIDAWFGNSGMGEFIEHPLLEQKRTIGLPATGRGCIAVASHITKNKWRSDNGNQDRPAAVLGRSSKFSSLGPTRDGRPKPEVSAPGELITAALAAHSELALAPDFASFRYSPDRILSIQGTSMACPVVTGVVALMLQKKATLTTAQIQDILERTAEKDPDFGIQSWHPAYGYGKIRIAAALAAIA
jgi:subtilisin family serine protease